MRCVRRCVATRGAPFSARPALSAAARVLRVSALARVVPRRRFGLGADEGGTGCDDFVLRLLHAFYTPPNAPKQWFLRRVQVAVSCANRG
eukprot:4103188-Prymnesium_polylepis.1